MEKILPKLIGICLNAICIFSPRKAGQLALKLFATPRKREITQRQNEFLNSSERKTLDYEGLDIMTYNWTGAGKTVLLVHGWESHAARWKALIRLLKEEDYNIVAIDAPAHGRSGGNVFNAILYSHFIQESARHFDPYMIVGHSVGGMASIFYAHREMNPSLEKLVLLGAPAHFEGVLERYVQLMGYSKAVHRAISKQVEEGFHHKPEYFSSAEFSKDLPCKVLLVHDDNDSIIPYDDALLYAENLKSVEFMSTNGLGHGQKDISVFRKIIEFAGD